MFFTGLFNYARQKVHHWQLRKAIDRSLQDAATITQFKIMSEGARAWEFLQKIHLPVSQTPHEPFDDLIVRLVASIGASYSIEPRLQDMFESQIPPPKKVVARLKSLGFKPFSELPDTIKAPPDPQTANPETRHAAAAYLVGKFIEKPNSFPHIQDAALFYALYFSKAAQEETARQQGHAAAPNAEAAPTPQHPLSPKMGAGRTEEASPNE